MPALMGMKNILVINDEAHHCYREKPDDGDDEELKGDGEERGRKEKEGSPRMDFRSRSREPKAQRKPGYRLISDALLS